MADTTLLLRDIISNNEDIYEIKQRLKQSLSDKGVDMQDIPFDRYPEKVDEFLIDDQKPPETQEKTLAPTPQGASVAADKNKYLSKVTVLGDGNLTPANIVKGVSIFGVEGEIDTEKGLGDFQETLFLEGMPASSTTILSTTMTNGDIIMSSTSTNYPGLWLYNATGSEITSIRDNSTWSIHHPVNDDCLVGSTATTGIGLCLYRKNYSDMITVIESGYNWNIFAITENDRLIYGTNSITLGIYLYDSELREVRQLHPDGYGWSVIQKVGEDYLISSNQSSCKGLLLYESDTKTIREIWGLGYHWGFFQMVENKYLVSGLNSASTGILCFDSSDRSIIQAYPSGYYWNNFAVLGEKTYISSTSSYGVGVLAYDHESGEIEQVIPTLHSFTMHLFRDGKLLILSSNNTNSGLIVCDDEDGVQYDYKEGQHYKSIEMDNGIVFAGIGRIALYDYETNEINTLYDAVGTWTLAHSIDNKLVFRGTSTDSGMVIYNDSYKTIEQMCDFGSGWSYLFGTSGRCVFKQSGGFALCDLSEGITLDTYSASNISYLNTVKELSKDYSIVYNDTSSTSTGILLCNLRDGRLVLVHNQGCYWRNAIEFPTGWAISSNTSSSLGLFFLNSETGEMMQIASVGYNWTSIKALGEHTLIGSNNGVFLYHGGLKTITRFSASGSLSNIEEKSLSNGFYVVYSGISNHAFGFYVVGAYSLLKGSTSGYDWTGCHEVNGGFLIFSSNSNGQGIYFYDTGDETLEQIYNAGYAWNFLQKLGDDYLLSSAYSGGEGILMFNFANKTIVQKYSTGYNWSVNQAIGENYIISSNTSSITGMLFYSKSTGDISLKVNVGYNWRIKAIYGDKCFIYSPASANYGMYYFDGETFSQVSTSSDVINEINISDNIRVLYTNGSYGFWIVDLQRDTIFRGSTSGNDWSMIDSFGDNAIIRSSSSDHIYMYDSGVDTVTLLSSSSEKHREITQVSEDIYVVFGNDFTGFCVFNNATNKVVRMPIGDNWGVGNVLAVEGGCLISSTNSTHNGIYFYDAVENTIRQAYSDGCAWDRVVGVDSGYIVFSSVAKNTGIPLYDKTSREITIAVEHGVGWRYISDTSDGILITADDPEVIGVFLLNPQTLALEQVFDIGYNWSLSTIIGNDILLASPISTNTGLVLYDANDKVVSLVFDSGYAWGISSPVENGLLIVSNKGNGILFYDTDEKSIVTKFDDGHGWDTITPVGNYFLVITSSSDTDCGICLYEPDKHSVTKLLDSSSDLGITDMSENVSILYLKDQIEYFLVLDTVEKTVLKSDIKMYGDYITQQVGESYLISSSKSVGGLYLYDSREDTLARVHTQYYNWKFQLVGGNCLMTPLGYGGIFLYESDSKTIGQIFTGHWGYFQTVGSNCLISSSDSTQTGVLLYESSTRTITQKYSSGYNWNIFQMVGTDCLISSSNWAGSGVLLYASSGKTVTQKYSSGYNWNIFQMVGTDCLISSSSGAGSGVLLYASSGKTVTQKYSSGFNWNQFLIGNNNNYCLISSTSSHGNGVLLYTGSYISSPHTSGYGWNQYEPFGSGYIITSSNKSDPGILYFSGSSVAVITTTAYSQTFPTSRGYIAVNKDMEKIIEVDQVDETIKVLYTKSSGDIQTMIEVGDVYIFYKASQTITYNRNSCEFNQFATRFTSAPVVTEFKYGVLVYNNNDSTGGGMLLLDKLTQKAAMVVSKGRYPNCYSVDNLLIFSGSSKGTVAIFNQDNNNYTTINAGYAYNSYAWIGSTNAVCINSAEDAIIYNAENNKATALVKSGTAYTESSFIEYEGKYYIINTVLDTGVLEYDPELCVVKKVFAHGYNYNQLHGSTLISAATNSLSFFSYNILTRQRGYYVNGIINDKYIYNTTFIQSLRNAGFQAFTFPYDIQKLITDGTVITNGSIIRKVE